MRTLSKPAWENLDIHEQTALSLNLGHSKSTWEAGEIMDRSHYKYLEIRARAEHFLKLFTEYYSLFSTLIPTQIEGDAVVIQFFTLCIAQRKKTKEALLKINETRRVQIKKSNLNERIEKQLKLWQKSTNISETKLYDLIKDFDRWNNFRILPKHLQEPSAFKRRLKNVYKKQLKTLQELNPIARKHLLKLVRATSKKDKMRCLYLPMLEGEFPVIYRVKKIKEYSDILDSVGLYYFTKAKDAEAYLKLIMTYLLVDDRSCQIGLKFWPQFRDFIKRANNYDRLTNKTPSRKFLEIAGKGAEYL